jgi:hypothetical protein
MLHLRSRLISSLIPGASEVDLTKLSNEVVGLNWRHLFSTKFNLASLLTTFLIIIRLEKAAKAEKEENSVQENPRELLNLDQAGLDFR